MLRRTLLYLSNQRQVAGFVRRNRLAKGFADRFVAGETLDDALRAVRRLSARGITATLDLLGESVTNEAEARRTARAYVATLDRMHSEQVEPNISIKLTAMGLDIAQPLCIDLMREVLERARQLNGFVRIDMESSAYTQRALDLFEKRLYPQFGDCVGIVLQSYLYRTADDVARANAMHAGVRLCKGAYMEPPSVAYPDKKDVDENYLRAMHMLLLEGNYPAIATHDERVIAATKSFARDHEIGPHRFEFQMLYGVRRDLQERLVAEGYRMRVYVPFGTQWYPYLMRRLAERPANVAFLTGNVLREAVSGRRRRTRAR
jgi:proline dehydrogenase